MFESIPGSKVPHQYFALFGVLELQLIAAECLRTLYESNKRMFDSIPGSKVLHEIFALLGVLELQLNC